MLRLLRATTLSTIAFTLVMAYFAVHLFVGQQGLLSWFEYNQTSRGLMAEAKALAERRAALEARVKRLRSAKIDADYVEERAFAQLGMAHPDDLVIRLPAKPQAVAAATAPATARP